VEYRIPRELRLVEALAKTVVGKTDKSRLRVLAQRHDG
jgi:non-ribosomal peptide synthetase component E (peptide arylation enzyme)